MLLVFAHPDDEAFTCGGLVPKYVDAGWKVHLVCATRGEVGDTGKYGEISHDNLGEIRASELRASAIILGISSVFFLGYWDGKLKKELPGLLEDTLYRKMIEVAPDVVITMEPNGISNHPDHIRLTHSTTYAFQNYTRDTAHPDAKMRTPKRNLLLKSEEFVKRSLSETDGLIDAPKLYYACVPKSVVTFLQKNKVFPLESFGEPWVGVPDKSVTTVIDISRYLTKKLRSLKAHVTQRDDVLRFVSINSQPLVLKEYFILRMIGQAEIYMGKNDGVSNRL